MDQAVVDAYVDAQREWLAREPVPDRYPVTRAHLVAKRALWRRWRAEGEAAGLLPGYCPDGFARWAAAYAPDR